MKLIKLRIALLVVLLIGMMFSYNAFAITSMPVPKSTAQPINKVVAIVNDNIILSSQFEQALSQAQQQARSTHMQLPDLATLHTIILNQLIARSLMLQIAIRNNIQVTDEQLNATLARMAHQQQISVKELIIQAVNQGYTKASFKKEITNEILINQVQVEAVGKTISISAADIATVKNQIMQKAQGKRSYNFMDVMVPLPDQSTAIQLSNARASALKLRQELQAGVNSKKLAQWHVISQGWQEATSIPQLFVDQLNTLKSGGISKPIRTGNGFHILKFIAKKGSSDKIPTDAQIKQIIFQQKLSAAVQKWILKLRKASYIKIM